MPKRGRVRGGSRGGRGRPNRGGRGGYIGGKQNKYNKKRNRGGGQNSNGPVGGRDYPELMDMNNPDFVSVSHPERSMRAAAARRSRGSRLRLQDEVFNTEDNMENTMKLPLRKRPVEFVKASTYDPTKDIIRKLREKEDYLEKVNNDEVTFVKEEANNQTSDRNVTEDDDSVMEVGQQNFQEGQHDQESDVIVVEDESVIKELPNGKSNDAILIEEEEEDEDMDIEGAQTVTIKEAETEQALGPMAKETKKAVNNELAAVPDDALFFKDDEGEPGIDVKVNVVRDSSYTSPTSTHNNASPMSNPKSCTEFNPGLSIGHVYLPTTQTSNGDVHTSLPKGKTKSSSGFNPDQSIYELEDDDEDLLSYNKTASKDLYQSYNKYIARVLHNLEGNSDDEDDVTEDYDNNDEIIDEKLDQNMFAELDDDFDEEAKFIANVDESDMEQDEEVEEVVIKSATGDKTADQFNKLNIQEDRGKEAKTEPEEPEYGFLPEDYESFDHSSVDVINIRYGAGANQYFMKSFRLTGSYDFAWVDQDMFQDFLVENGMPEHRLNAYFKYVQAQLTPADEPDEKDYDLPISDSSEEEEEENHHDDYDDEGLNDLINFTTKYDGVRDLEFDTKTLKTRGKGRKKELDLDHIADDDLRQSLADQYQTHRQTKRDKRKDRESNVAREHAASKDLSLKYPYTIYVKDFRAEFEEFLQDSKRTALSFPPLDPHGNKVVMKFAYLYNMKSRKFGQGKQQHVVAVKNKRTYHSMPDYHSVGMLCKQRPVFNRIDQKRPRVEIEAEEAKS